MFKILQFHEGKENEEIKSKAAYILYLLLSKELSLCHKLSRFSNTYIFATQCRRP